MASLVNDQEWTLDDALHEVYMVRSDVVNLLSPRPIAVGKGDNRKSGGPSGSTGSQGGGKGARDGKGKRKGDNTKGSGSASTYQGGQSNRGSKRPWSQMESQNRESGGGKGKSEKVTWPSDWAVKTKEGKQICMRYSLNSCMFSNCKFEHVCPIMVNGQACGKKGPAYEHHKH